MLFVDPIMTCPEISSGHKCFTNIITESVVKRASRDFLTYGLEWRLIQLVLLLIIPTEVILKLSVGHHFFLVCFNMKVNYDPT